MTDITHAAPAAQWSQRLVDGIGSTFTAFGRALIISRQSQARLRQIEKLQAKSDAELSAMGLARDRIVHHVFRDINDL